MSQNWHKKRNKMNHSWQKNTNPKTQRKISLRKKEIKEKENSLTMN